MTAELQAELRTGLPESAAATVAAAAAAVWLASGPTAPAAGMAVAVVTLETATATADDPEAAAVPALAGVAHFSSSAMDGLFKATQHTRHSCCTFIGHGCSCKDAGNSNKGRPCTYCMELRLYLWMMRPMWLQARL